MASAHVQQLHREMLAGVPGELPFLLHVSMPHDVTLRELRIECMYPADADTDAFARALAAQG